MRMLESFVRWWDIDLESKEKERKFHERLAELVSILFAVVFGVGLEEIGKIAGVTDGVTLGVAYIAVVLSWWGYHYGTIQGQSETNGLCYLLDVLIVVIYWLLINQRQSIVRVTSLYLVMFLLYVLWELVRVLQGRWRGARRALRCNVSYCVPMVMFVVAALIGKPNKLLVMASILVLLIAYRFRIHDIYKNSPMPEG